MKIILNNVSCFKQFFFNEKVEVGKDQEKAQSEKLPSQKCTLLEGTSRQRSGKGAIRKKFHIYKMHRSFASKARMGPGN